MYCIQTMVVHHIILWKPFDYFSPERQATFSAWPECVQTPKESPCLSSHGLKPMALSMWSRGSIVVALL